MRYLVARFFQGIVTIFGVTILTFFLPSVYFNPFSLGKKVLGNRSTKLEVDQWIRRQGFDKPLVEQYFHWLNNALHFRFGISYAISTQFHTVSVDTVLNGAVWRSVWLVLIPTVISIVIAIPLGLSQAIRRNRIYDHSVTTVVYVLYSIPTILACLLLQYYGGDVLKIAPPNMNSYAVEIPAHRFPLWMLEHFNYFILPFTAIIVLSVGGLTRFMRGSALDTLVQDHVRTARAKGAGTTRVLFRHVLRPSLIPMITIIGLSFPAIIGGALIVEYAFSYPGMGALAVSSVEIGDFTVVMAITLCTAIFTVAGNFLADVFVAVADPRVRLGAGR